jgi:hypothetical protein
MRCGTEGTAQEDEAVPSFHAAGMPVLAAHYLVHVDGRLGIVFVRVEGVSMLSQVQAKPWTLFRAIAHLAQCTLKFTLKPPRWSFVHSASALLTGLLWRLD